MYNAGLRRRDWLAAAALLDPGRSRSAMSQGLALRSACGLRAHVIPWGATLTELAPAGWPNVLLALPDLAAYQRSNRRWAGTLGRFAGRLAPGGFTLNGRPVALRSDRATLHGGSPGFDQRDWRLQAVDDAEGPAVLACLDSPAGDQGFPGHLKVRATLQLLHAAPTLRIRYEACSDADTVVNLSNHAYLNLAGAGAEDLAAHRFRLAPARLAELDARKLPTGRLVAPPPELDFSAWRALPAREVDHAYLLDGHDGRLRCVAEVQHLPSGRRLALWSTLPALVFHPGEAFDGSERGAEGQAYGRRAGFALETQYLPDSPNHRHFPSSWLKAGETWRATTEWRFAEGSDSDTSEHLNQRTDSHKTHG